MKNNDLASLVTNSTIDIDKSQTHLRSLKQKAFTLVVNKLKI